MITIIIIKLLLLLLLSLNYYYYSNFIYHCLLMIYPYYSPRSILFFRRWIPISSPVQWRHGAMAKSNAPLLPGPVQHAFEAARWVNGLIQWLNHTG